MSKVNSITLSLPVLNYLNSMNADFVICKKDSRSWWFRIEKWLPKKRWYSPARWAEKLVYRNQPSFLVVDYYHDRRPDMQIFVFIDENIARQRLSERIEEEGWGIWKGQEEYEALINKKGASVGH